MNFGNRSPNIASVFAIIIGILFSFYIGSLIGNGGIVKMAMIMASILAVVLVLAMRTHVWVLIPLTWELSGSVSILPLPFSVREMGVLFVAGCYMVFFALKLIRERYENNTIWILLWINLAWLFFSFVRNPVGMDAIGSDLVGGRPYMVIGLGMIACFITSLQKIGDKFAKIFPFLILGPTLVVAIISGVTYFFPGIVPIIAPFYSGITSNTYLAEYLGNDEGFSLDDRLTWLGSIGSGIITLGFCYWDPKTMLNPLYVLRFFTLIVGIAGIFLSGFRSGLASIFILMVLAAYFYEGIIGSLRFILTAIIAFTILALAQGSLIDLPLSAQRALSFLPGHWNQEARDDAEASSNWRFEMWKIALTTDRYIKNKWLGDGFGFTRTDYQIMRNADFGSGNGFGGENANQEAFMIQGTFHSGPVTTIRVVGYIGLLLYLALLIAVARYSWQLIRSSWDTPFRYISLGLGSVNILTPFSFVFIFGDYGTGFPTLLFSIGLLNMVQKSKKAYLQNVIQKTGVLDPSQPSFLQANPPLL